MAQQALLIIDVQRGFVTDATRHVVAAAEALQPRYQHVYATRFINPDESPFRRWLDWHRFSEDSPEIELALSLRSDAIVLDKHTYTAVTEQLLSDLQRNGISEVHICGIDTDGCVLKTAVDLFEAGIRPLVLARSCASTAGPDFHEYGLRALARMIGAPQIAGLGDGDAQD